LNACFISILKMMICRVLQEFHGTTEDEYIRNTDIPERYITRNFYLDEEVLPSEDTRKREVYELF